MKIVILFTLVALAIAQESYPSRYDNINIDEILQKERLFKSYLNCLLDAGPCSPEGSELKKYLPDAVSTGCRKCTDKQRKVTAKVVKFVIEQHPEQWKALRAKYDPENTFAEMYREEAARIGITI